MPPDTAPHLEDSSIATETATEQNKLRAAAARAELQPERTRLKRAMSLLHQMSGYIAGSGLELPIAIHQEYSVLVHEDVLARKEQA